MIQAGTISSGSACTSPVTGAYWISSIRRLRNTTRPGVAATSMPGRKASQPASGGRPRPLDILGQLRRAAHEVGAAFAHGDFQYLRIGGGKLTGETMSSSWREENSTTSSWWLVTPSMPVVALCHHCWLSRKACCSCLYGQRCQPGAVKRRSCGSGSTGGSAAMPRVLRASQPSQRRSLRQAFSSSCCHLAGDSARCMPQSIQASVRLAGDKPWVSSPIIACNRRSALLGGSMSGMAAGEGMIGINTPAIDRDQASIAIRQMPLLDDCQWCAGSPAIGVL
jgi:hypothetical protein